MARDPKSSYYDEGGIETLDIIRAKLTPEEYLGFLKGTALRYLCRAPFKHPDQARDLEKIANYGRWASEFAAEMAEVQAVADIPESDRVEVHDIISEMFSESGMPSTQEVADIVRRTGEDILATIEACREEEAEPENDGLTPLAKFMLGVPDDMSDEERPDTESAGLTKLQAHMREMFGPAVEIDDLPDMYGVDPREMPDSSEMVEVKFEVPETRIWHLQQEAAERRAKAKDKSDKWDGIGERN